MLITSQSFDSISVSDDMMILQKWEVLMAQLWHKWYMKPLHECYAKQQQQQLNYSNTHLVFFSSLSFSICSRVISVRYLMFCSEYLFSSSCNRPMEAVSSVRILRRFSYRGKGDKSLFVCCYSSVFIPSIVGTLLLKLSFLVRDRIVCLLQLSSLVPIRFLVAHWTYGIHCIDLLEPCI